MSIKDIGFLFEVEGPDSGKEGQLLYPTE